jgi:hypothetical protein
MFEKMSQNFPNKSSLFPRITKLTLSSPSQSLETKK